MRKLLLIGAAFVLCCCSVPALRSQTPDEPGGLPITQVDCAKIANEIRALREEIAVQELVLQDRYNDWESANYAAGRAFEAWENASWWNKSAAFAAYEQAYRDLLHAQAEWGKAGMLWNKMKMELSVQLRQYRDGGC